MKKTQQRGSAWSIALVFNLYKLFGYNFIYWLMYPVTFFYFLVASNVKTALKSYYLQIHKPFNNRIYFTHLRIFAMCMVDRFISKVNPKSYTVEYTHFDEVTLLLNEGCVLLCSHYGGWAASSNLSHVSNKVNVVMEEVLLEGIKKIENKIESQDNVHIIDLNQGQISVSVQIANALMKHEIVAMMADRAASVKAEEEMSFFNKEAKFNKNPFQIAYKLQKPILVFFVILIEKQCYKIESLRIDMNKTLNEEQAVIEAMNIYTKKFEQVIEQYPNQWFNFYNFWGKE